MTHLLIPIADIDNWIAEIKKAGLTITPFEEAEIQTLERIKEGKQISLDEKNIEEKATKYTSNIKENLLLNELVGRKRGYKQALKDLL